MKLIDKDAIVAEKGEQKSVNVDIESMVALYKKRVIEQCNGMEDSPFVSMCLTAFRRGIENTLDELKLNNDFIEYTRTDAFIDRASKWIKKKVDNTYFYISPTIIQAIIDEFRNYMKGE